jgi:hypothetical protein
MLQGRRASSNDQSCTSSPPPHRNSSPTHGMEGRTARAPLGRTSSGAHRWDSACHSPRGHQPNHGQHDHTIRTCGYTHVQRNPRYMQPWLEATDASSGRGSRSCRGKNGCDESSETYQLMRRPTLRAWLSVPPPTPAPMVVRSELVVCCATLRLSDCAPDCLHDALRRPATAICRQRFPDGRTFQPPRLAAHHENSSSTADNPRLSGGSKSGLYRVGRTVGIARAGQA